MNRYFVRGIALGTIATISAIAGAVIALDKRVVQPSVKSDQNIDENRRRAVRKSYSSHQA